MTSTDAIASSAVMSNASRPRSARAKLRTSAHRGDLVVAGPEDRPLLRAGLAVARDLPPDLDRALAAADADEVVDRLVDAPREVDGAEHVVLGAQEHLRGVLDVETLDPTAFDRVHVGDAPEEEARDVDRVGAVVDEHAAAGDVGPRSSGRPSTRATRTRSRTGSARRGCPSRGCRGRGARRRRSGTSRPS